MSIYIILFVTSPYKPTDSKKNYPGSGFAHFTSVHELRTLVYLVYLRINRDVPSPPTAWLRCCRSCMHHRLGSSKLFRWKATSDCDLQLSRTRHTQDGPEADLVDIVDFPTQDCSHSRIRKCNVVPPWPKHGCVTISLPDLLTYPEAGRVNH